MQGTAPLSSSTSRHQPKVQAYVLVTPARNEAAFIEKTLRAMVAQTAPPLRWAIVSDGSTDGTDELVQKYAAQHPWIELVKMPPRAERHFAGKVYAFNAGYERVKGLDYEVIGNLDGDSSFDADYIEYLLGKFAENPRLGVAGTNYVEDEWDLSLKHDYRFANIEDVTGQCQLFRRDCFEAIGGYKPNKMGGIGLPVRKPPALANVSRGIPPEQEANHFRSLPAFDRVFLGLDPRAGKNCNQRSRRFPEERTDGQAQKNFWKSSWIQQRLSKWNK